MAKIWSTTGCGHLTAAGKHRPPLRLRSVGASVATSLYLSNVVNGGCADDIVIGFDNNDAQRFRIAMQRRLRGSDSRFTRKTRLMEFGPARCRKPCHQGKGKPETFFLGFCIQRKDRNGRFMLIRKTRQDRMTATLKAIKDGLRRRWHYSIPEQGKWLQESGSGIPELSLGTERFPTMQKFRTRNKPLAPERSGAGARG